MNSDSFWNRYDIEQKVVAILDSVAYTHPDHHFGRPFLTAYQLAILFKERFPEEYEMLGHTVGGRDSGVQFSLTNYLAGQLSSRIGRGEITDIEGCFLSNCRLLGIEFRDAGHTVTSSSTGSQFDLSMYRLRDPSNLNG